MAQKTIRIGKRELEFIRQAIELKEAVMPLDDEHDDDEFKESFGCSKLEMRNAIDSLERKTR